MKNLSDRIELPKFKRLVVAISGGMDSVVLAHLLNDQNIVLAHLNHGIRRQADSDEEFVMDLAKKWGVEAVSEKRKMPRKGNLENNARQIRYEFLEKVRISKKADYIVVAHHFDDQIETVLMHVSRGAGLRGKRGMEKASGKIIRPLLEVSKKAIEAYARKNKLEYREDKTNFDTDYERNKWRHIIIPELRKNTLNFDESIRKMTKEAASELEKISSEASGWIEDHLTAETFGRIVFNRLPKDLRSEILIQILGADDLYQKGIELLIEFIEKGATGKKMLVKEKPFYIQYGQILLTPPKETAVLPKKRITRSGIKWGKWKIASKGDGLFVRQWKAGDKFQPSGMKGSKKLQDLFVDLKIPKQERSEIPIIVDAKNAIMAVGDLRVAQGAEDLKKNLELN